MPADRQRSRSSCRERAVNPVVVDYTAELEHDGRVFYPVTVNGGALVCEEGDFVSGFSEPPCEAFRRFARLARALGERNRQRQPQLNKMRWPQ